MKYCKSYLSLTLILVFACSEEVIFDFNEQLNNELTEIDHFLVMHSISAEVHETQLRYTELVEGVGEPTDRGDTVFFNFQLYSLDSTLYHTNIDSLQQVHNNYRSGPGWYVRTDYLGNFLAIGAELAKDQSVLQLFVPSYLAFDLGRYGITSIPSSAPILVQFDILRIGR